MDDPYGRSVLLSCQLDNMEADVLPVSIVKSTWLDKLHHSLARMTRSLIHPLSVHTPSNITGVRFAISKKVLHTPCSSRCHI